MEAFVKTPFSVCEERDIKGLYKLARAGKIKDFTGIHISYEEPDGAEMVLETCRFSVEELVTQIASYLDKHVGFVALCWVFVKRRLSNLFCYLVF